MPDEAEAAEVNGLLSADDIQGWKHRTLHWYDSGESRHKKPIKYFTLDGLLGFVSSAVGYVAGYITERCSSLKE